MVARYDRLGSVTRVTTRSILAGDWMGLEKEGPLFLFNSTSFTSQGSGSTTIASTFHYSHSTRGPA